MDQQTLSIYLHVPFCATKCSYCAFNTYTNMEHLIEQFVAAMITEIKILAIDFGGSLPIGSIYLGGGTPSLLGARQIDAILSAIDTHYMLPSNAEISMEANPSDLESRYLTELSAVGITRLSVGMQSAHLHELALFQRRHTMRDVIQSIDNARHAGFVNINLDLIYGVPHQTLQMWQSSLRQLIALCPEHISLYALGLEPDTAMFNWVEKGDLPRPDDDVAADMYELASETLTTAGYEQYEISNWSKQGYNCQHNLQYWRNLEYIGLGPGAHGFVNGYRYSNILSPVKYIRILRELLNTSIGFPHIPVVDEFIFIDQREEMVETLILGLRLTKEGILRKNFIDRFSVDVFDVYGNILQQSQQNGLLEIADEYIRITPQGRLLSNVLFRQFI